MSSEVGKPLSIENCTAISEIGLANGLAKPRMTIEVADNFVRLAIRYRKAGSIVLRCVFSVIPAKAGIQDSQRPLDPVFRRGDDGG
jgi:hypothetical protein